MELGNRIAVLGIPGSGKTTLSLIIGIRLGLPVFHLDRILYRAGWKLIPGENFRAEVGRIASGDRWVIEGDYPEFPDARVDRADTVIYLALNRYICMLRTVKRLITGGKDNRGDISPGCEERMNADFIRELRWIWDFDRKHRTMTEARLRDISSVKKVITLSTPSELNRFEASLLTV